MSADLDDRPRRFCSLKKKNHRTWIPASKDRVKLTWWYDWLSRSTKFCSEGRIVGGVDSTSVSEIPWRSYCLSWSSDSERYLVCVFRRSERKAWRTESVENVRKRVRRWDVPHECRCKATSRDVWYWLCRADHPNWREQMHSSAHCSSRDRDAPRWLSVDRVKMFHWRRLIGSFPVGLSDRDTSRIFLSDGYVQNALRVKQDNSGVRWETFAGIHPVWLDMCHRRIDSRWSTVPRRRFDQSRLGDRRSSLDPG